MIAEDYKLLGLDLKESVSIENELLTVVDQYEEMEEEKGFLDETEIEAYLLRAKAVVKKIARMVVYKEKVVADREREVYPKKE
jgi:hypothetical protein